jgi:hypothetical protein
MIPIRQESVEVNLNQFTASMHLRNLTAFDRKTIPNSLREFTQD